MLNSALGALRGSIYRSPARTLLPGPCGVKRRSQRVHLSRSRTPTVPRALSSLSLTSLAAPATGHRTCRCAVDHARDRTTNTPLRTLSHTSSTPHTRIHTHFSIYSCDRTRQVRPPPGHGLVLHVLDTSSDGGGVGGTRPDASSVARPPDKPCHVSPVCNPN